MHVQIGVEQPALMVVSPCSSAPFRYPKRRVVGCLDQAKVNAYVIPLDVVGALNFLNLGASWYNFPLPHHDISHDIEYT